MSNLQLSRVVPQHVHREQFEWLKRNFMTFGEFRGYRQRKHIALEPFDKCWWCKVPFTDTDIMHLAGRKKGNRALCDHCADQMIAGIGK